LFLPSAKKLGSRKRWIRFVSTPKGKVVLDDGAVKALIERRVSLLPAGIKKVVGSFAAGTVVEMTTLRGRAVARGVTNFSASELSSLAGHPSAEFSELLGRAVPQEAVHRDNLFLL
jgi:glutamate 5-kinase